MNHHALQVLTAFKILVGLQFHCGTFTYGCLFIYWHLLSLTLLIGVFPEFLDISQPLTLHKDFFLFQVKKSFPRSETDQTPVLLLTLFSDLLILCSGFVQILLPCHQHSLSSYVVCFNIIH